VTVTSWTFEHYNRPEVKEIILNLSREGAYSRWGCGDGHGWYKQESGKKKALNLSQEKDYNRIIPNHRTLYWTLNYFDIRTFDTDYHKVTQEESPLISRQHTNAYTLGIDIDKGHGCDIHTPEVKKAVEDMGQYYAERLRTHAPNSVHVLFSGGGIYVLLHHKVIEDYFRRYISSNEWERWLNILLKAYGYVIEDIRKQFFKDHPEHNGKVKPDSLNNSKRVFKTIFSIHLKQPYAVIPIDPDNIKIDFDQAKLPLSNEVIDSGKQWYQSYDNDNRFLQFLKPYLIMAKDEMDNHTYRTGGNSTPFNLNADTSHTPINKENWPPCIKNMLKLRSCGEGRTRALAFLAAFLGQAAIPEEQAKDIFYGLARRWGATTANIFTSYYQKMRVPTCYNLKADDNTGFPQGVSINHLGICRPDPQCINIPSPRYYADNQANVARLKARLTSSKPEIKQRTTSNHAGQ
jgi:hypothetical protein